MCARRWSIIGAAVLLDGMARRPARTLPAPRRPVDPLFRWLDSSSAYSWQMPRGLERVERKIPKTDGERRLSAITKDIYKVEELAELNRWN